MKTDTLNFITETNELIIKPILTYFLIIKRYSKLQLIQVYLYNNSSNTIDNGLKYSSIDILITKS